MKREEKERKKEKQFADAKAGLQIAIPHAVKLELLTIQPGQWTFILFSTTDGKCLLVLWVQVQTSCRDLR